VNSAEAVLTRGCGGSPGKAFAGICGLNRFCETQ